MLVNLKNFKAIFHENGSMEVRLQTTEMLSEKVIRRDFMSGENKEVPGEFAEYPTSIYITSAELPLFISCLEGAENYPWFDDIMYLLRVFPNGMRVMKLRDTTYQKWEVIFPFKLWEQYIRDIKYHLKNPGEEFVCELSEGNLQYFTEVVAPKIQWNFKDHKEGEWKDFKWEEHTTRSMTASLGNWMAEYPDLKKYMLDLENWATSYSVYGNLVEIDINFDYWKVLPGIPDSYDFHIHTILEGKEVTIVHGGIIAHDNRDGTFHYSQHT